MGLDETRVAETLTDDLLAGLPPGTRLEPAARDRGHARPAPRGRGLRACRGRARHQRHLGRRLRRLRRGVGRVLRRPAPARRDVGAGPRRDPRERADHRPARGVGAGGPRRSTGSSTRCGTPNGHRSGAGPIRAPRPPGFGPSVGRYLHLDDGRRIFVETAGEGPPLLCLHTAGADSRQFRGLLEDPRVTDHHRVVAFDMPWHGRSDPPDDWQHRRYALDTRDVRGDGARGRRGARARPPGAPGLLDGRGDRALPRRRARRPVRRGVRARGRPRERRALRRVDPPRRRRPLRLPGQLGRRADRAVEPGGTARADPVGLRQQRTRRLPGRHGVLLARLPPDRRRPRARDLPAVRLQRRVRLLGHHGDEPARPPSSWAAS